MNELGQRKFLPSPKVIRNIGITIFALSFIVPTYHEDGTGLHFFGGCIIFVWTPVQPLMALVTDNASNGGPTFGGLTRDVFFGGLMWGSWLTNFTIFFRLPIWAVLIVVTLPWAAFFWLFPELVETVPFYFWTSGIACIHLSRIIKPCVKKAPEHLTAIGAVRLL